MLIPHTYTTHMLTAHMVAWCAHAHVPTHATCARARISPGPSHWVQGQWHLQVGREVWPELSHLDTTEDSGEVAFALGREGQV